jgi:hypothetical protein
MKDDMHWKDIELKEMRDELERLKTQNQSLKVKHLEEKHERQLLNAKQTKYTVMGELLHKKSEIQENTFFEKMKSAQTSTDGSFKKIIKDKLKANHKASLAFKYGMKWLDIVRSRRQARQREEFYG